MNAQPAGTNFRRPSKPLWSEEQPARLKPMPTPSKIRSRCRHGLKTAFADVDVLLTPSATGEAPEGLDFTGAPEFNRIWTFTGTPCVTVPGLTGPLGLPVGIQIIGPLGGDASAIAAADWLRPLLTQ